MSVTGKFYVTSIEITSGADRGSVKLQAVSRGARNASWASATPSGSIQMYIDNPLAFKVFRDALAGGDREFFVHFEAAPIPKAADGHAFIPSPENHYNQGRCMDCGAAEADHIASD